MNGIIMLDPLVKSVEVNCSQKKAFELFLGGMENWWPLTKISIAVMNGGTTKSLRVEPADGGRIVEISDKNEEHLWGTVKSYQPNEFISMDFHIPHPSETTRVETRLELRFSSLNEGGTRVELTQSNWEGFGDMAEMCRGGYNGAWGMIFEQAYKSACES